MLSPKMPREVMTLFAFVLLVVISAGGYWVSTGGLAEIFDERAEQRQEEEENKNEEENEEAEVSVSVILPVSPNCCKDYSVDIEEGETALSVLKSLDEESAEFNFKYSEDPSFGAYITEVNGVKADDGESFWEFAVNAKLADKGISQYELSEGDKVGLKLTKIEADFQN